MALKRTPRITRFPLERSKVAELVRSFKDDDPVWFDAAAAADAGFSEIPMPPTVTVVADHWLDGGIHAIARATGMDFSRLLHGEASWEYLHPLRVGQEFTVASDVVERRKRDGRRGGAMTLIVIETVFRDDRGRVAVRRRDTLIETQAEA